LRWLNEVASWCHDHLPLQHKISIVPESIEKLLVA